MTTPPSDPAALVRQIARDRGLAQLLDVHEQKSAPADPFTGMAAARAHRKQELAALFSGQPPQPRDESGRFAPKPTTGFDGGARPQESRPPPESHEQWLAAVLASRAADRGGGF